MDMTRCSLGKFLVVPTFVTRRLYICKAARDLGGERLNYCREGCPAIFHKWLLSRHLDICFWISEPVFVQTIVFRVWVLDLRPVSAMYAVGSWLGPSDEIRLYANIMQRNLLNMRLKQELNLLKQQVFILLPSVFRLTSINSGYR